MLMSGLCLFLRDRPLKWTTVGDDTRRRQQCPCHLSCTTANAWAFTSSQARHLSCVYENSLEKSTLYKHSGPLDLGLSRSSSST